jgi:hypothetical protein
MLRDIQERRALREHSMEDCFTKRSVKIRHQQWVPMMTYPTHMFPLPILCICAGSCQNQGIHKYVQRVETF